MQLLLTAPLRIKTTAGQVLELLPIPMANGFPSETIAPWSALWCQFLKPNGRRMPCEAQAITAAQRYMRQHGTEALSEDGLVAFTVDGDALVECLPQVCNQIEGVTTDQGDHLQIAQA